MTHAQETSPLAQAFAAIIAMLIAAIAEHAREHPMLAGGCRASIRQLEKLSRRFEAMANEWHQHQSHPRKPGTRPPPPPKHRPRQESHMATHRRREDPSRRRCAVMCVRMPAARAPPRRGTRPHA